MTDYALRLANGQDTAPRVRAGDALALTPRGAVRARGGLRPDGGGVVTVQAGTMNVQVSPFSCWVDASAAGQVGYPFVSDSTKTLAIANGHASLSRTDVIAVVVKENAFDGSGSTSATLTVVQGTPGAGTPPMPTSSCIPLRNIVVPAGTSSGTGGLTSGMLSTDRRVYTAALGGVVPVASQADRDALAPGTSGLTVYRQDLDALEVWNGAAWRRYSPADDSGLITVGSGGSAPAYAAGMSDANAAADYKTRFRKIGTTVTIEIAVTKGATAVPIFTLPAGYAPSVPWFIPLASGVAPQANQFAIVRPSGAVEFASSGLSNTTYYGSVSYDV